MNLLGLPNMVGIFFSCFVRCSKSPCFGVTLNTFLFLPFIQSLPPIKGAFNIFGLFNKTITTIRQRLHAGGVIMEGVTSENMLYKKGVAAKFQVLFLPGVLEHLNGIAQGDLSLLWRTS